MEQLAEVEIDEGRFKYVLIEAKGSGKRKLIVRGFKDCGFHGDIMDRVETRGVQMDCLGGGRIIHDATARTIKVFGYSQGYGRADHGKTVEILKRNFPDYSSITVDDNPNLY